MSDSEEEDFAFFGNPLEPFDEDAVPRKKPLTVEDQIATDKHGKRRFHGAFTGGFSAGFFNSVGSLEGWKPSTFKSSRSERSSSKQQLPSHFMDDEDIDEFGIAPQVLRTKPEYGSSRKSNNKRDRYSNQSGPIPGEPVLNSILKPKKHTTGIILLMKMGWKPGQNIGEKLRRKLDKTHLSGKKVYGCARGPEDDTFATGDDSEEEDEIYRELGEAAPSYVRKEDNMGLGYRGLDRNALSCGIVRPSRTLTLRDQYNKSIKISGQAFGVGAFEEEDDDIYSTDDKSQYDFSLEPIGQSKKRKQIPAVTDGSNVILGFVKASFKETPKRYPGPIVPASFTGIHVEKASRFDLGPSGLSTAPTRQKLDANLRSVIIDGEPLPVKIKEEKMDEKEVSDRIDVASLPKKNGDGTWQPFASDPCKQERYQRFLNLIKIGAKDLVYTVLCNTMSDLERDAELREFEAAARLYSGNIMSDRFTHGNQNNDDGMQQVVKNEANIRRRLTSEWAPHPVVCKRFNIKPPNNSTGTSLQSVAESKKRPKFSVFEFLNASQSTNLLDLVESNSNRPDDDQSSSANETKCEIISDIPANDQNQTEAAVRLPLSSARDQEDEEFQEPADKMDLFKAIFLDSDDENEQGNSENVDKQPQSPPANPSHVERVNVLRNTSPPRGIFANLDLDSLSSRNNETSTNINLLKLTEPSQSIFHNHKAPVEPRVVKEEPTDIPEDSYGPMLPSVPISNTKSSVNLKLDVNDDRWVEKSEVGKTKSKHHKHKHKKKHKKEKKKDRERKKKKKKKYSSSSDTESD